MSRKRCLQDRIAALMADRRERTPIEIAARVDYPRASVRHELMRLRRAGALVGDWVGAKAFYRAPE